MANRPYSSRPSWWTTYGVRRKLDSSRAIRATPRKTVLLTTRCAGCTSGRDQLHFSSPIGMAARGSLLRNGKQSTTRRERGVGGFENAHNLEALASIGKGHPAGTDALEEMLVFQPQRFRARKVRNRDASVAIRQLELAKAVRVRGCVHTAVVDADLLQCLYVVVNGHLATAHNRNPPHLVGIKPANVNRSARAFREREVDVGNVLDPVLNIGRPVRTGSDGLRAEHVHQNGNVMWSKIPQNVDVALKEPKVQALGVGVINIAQFAAVHEIP